MKNNSDYINHKFISTSGEMGTLIREKDWSRTPLGHPETWPQSLRTMVSVMLDNPFGMYIAWGPEYIQLYNDGYRPILGTSKHPAALGISTRETFAEIWHIIGPMFGDVMNGKPVGFPDFMLPLNRNGFVEECYFDFSYSPIRKENGEVGGVLVTVIETTDKKKAENNLKESKNQLQFAIESTELATWDYNPLTNKFSGNTRLKKWFGLPEDEEVQLALAIDAMRPDHRERVTSAIAQALDFSSGGNYDIEYPIINAKTGEERIVRAKGKAWFDENKIAYRFNGTLQDVTEQFIALKKMAESEQRFQAAIRAISGVVWTNNAKGEMEGEQKEWSELTGQSYEEYQGFGWAKAVHPDDAQPTINEWKKAVDTKSIFNFEHRLLKKTREWGHFSIRSIPLLNSDGSIREWVGVHTDITEKRNADIALLEKEENLRNTILQAPVAMCIFKGENLIVELANDRMFELWGKTAEETINKPIFEGLPEAKDQGLEEILQGVYKTGKTFSADGVPITLPRNGGIELVYVNLVYEPYREADGKVSGILAVAIDVTAQLTASKKIEERELKFRLLADSMPQLVWTGDADGNLNYYNQSVYNFSGLTEEQVIIEGGWLEIVHPDEREENIKLWLESVITGTDFKFEHRFRRYDGEYRWQLSRAKPQLDENGNIQMWVGTSTDIQDQKVFAESLETQVRERTKQLAQNNIELEKMNKELQSFAYISSHDLQEPLRKIQTFASRIAEKEIDNLSENGKDLFMRMQASAARMQSLIDDLLAYSRTHTLERDFKKVNLSTVIEIVISDLEEEIQQKNAIIEAKKMGEVNIIPFQFQQLFYNLISNSLKFSKTEHPLHITINSEYSKGSQLDNEKLSSGINYCHISFADNGIGFEPQYNEKIFELFQRLHGKNEYDGTGIGLAIVKRIVENHNGIITANGELGKGATFDIYLPLDSQ